LPKRGRKGDMAALPVGAARKAVGKAKIAIR
jgi:hypothetical protein